MPSWSSYMTSWVLWALYYQRKHSTAHQIMERVARTWKLQYAKEAIPLTAKAAIAAGQLQMSEERFEGKGKGGQKWKVLHCALPEGARKGGNKVVIYWHGGAYINGPAPQHWAATQRIVKEYNLPVVFPHYTRIPESTAEGWCKNAIEFTLSIAADDRYKGLDIVHMGDSAGGWMALRMRQLMCGLLLGEERISGLKLDDAQMETIGSLVGRGSTIMISPVVNVEITDSLRELDSVDPWLGVEIFKLMRILWVKGPSEVPTIDFDLPRDQYIAAPLDGSHALASDDIYADSRYSLNNGLDVFKRYHDKHPDTAPFRLLTLIGTYDLCYVGCKDMDRRLRGLGGVVKSDYVEEEGLNHVYPLLKISEAERAWAKIGQVLME